MSGFIRPNTFPGNPMKRPIPMLVVLTLLLVYTVPSCAHLRSPDKKEGISSGRPTGYRVKTDKWEDEEFAAWCEETQNMICSSEYNYPYADED